MREIKFRAYDSKNEHMFYHDDEGNFDRCIDEIRVGSDFSITDLLFSPFECLTAMQFTELKDINGVDVYEGDILNHPNSGLFECRFKDNGFYLFYKNIIQKSTTTEHMEIIGNIHEKMSY